MSRNPRMNSLLVRMKDTVKIVINIPRVCSRVKYDQESCVSINYGWNPLVNIYISFLFTLTAQIVVK